MSVNYRLTSEGLRTGSVSHAQASSEKFSTSKGSSELLSRRLGSPDSRRGGGQWDGPGSELQVCISKISFHSYVGWNRRSTPIISSMFVQKRIKLINVQLDPGNLGGILRTAYFFGVDAVAISNRNGAPLSPVALKASAGASEVMELMSIAHPRAFIDESQRNGWKFYAGVAPSGSTGFGSKRVARLTTSTLRCPARDHPCVLMLGGEGEGLSWDLQKKADFELGVEGYRAGQGGVDSLNVGVATGLLCEAFLRKTADHHVIKGRAEADKVEGGERLF